MRREERKQEDKMMFVMVMMLVTMAHAARILEHPEDVTVLVGEPATLQCRVSEGPVVWFKDGLEMRLRNKRSVVQLPDGSLFFLTTASTDTALYHCETQDGVGSFPAALIVGTEEEGIVPTAVQQEREDAVSDDTDDGDDTISDISIEIQDIPADADVVMPLEVGTGKELPRSVYIISMAVVAVLTIVIILGAALVFNKIKKVNSSNSDTMSGDRESTTPMMYSVPRTMTLDAGDMRGQNIVKHPHHHYNYVLHNEYDTPVHFVSSDIYKCVNNSLEKQRTSPSNSYHYASSNIVHSGSSKRSTASYSAAKNGLYSPKDNSNYFSC